MKPVKVLALARKQSGAVLLVALISLLALTLLGMAAIDSSGLQMKMANNHRERMIAMQAAEAGLRAGEEYVENLRFTPEMIASEFSDDCENGLCFIGDMASDVLGCTVDSVGLLDVASAIDDLVNSLLGGLLGGLFGALNLSVLEDLGLPVLGEDGIQVHDVLENFSDDTPQPRAIELPRGKMQARVKYYITFDCYVRGSPTDINLTDNPHQLFTITSYAETLSGKGRVMLRSTYKVPSS